MGEPAFRVVPGTTDDEFTSDVRMSAVSATTSDQVADRVIGLQARGVVTRRSTDPAPRRARDGLDARRIRPAIALLCLLTGCRHALIRIRRHARS